VSTEERGTILRELRRLAARQAGILSDRELMERFVSERDEAAFETILRRHGPMVLHVCGRILRDEHAAEDAFQATFLVLARKAGTLQRQESVGNWLYGVATRLALRTRADAARERDRQQGVTAKSCRDPLDELTVREAQQILDEELSRLPDRYRAALVLCCLEGLARDEAAQQLGCPAATVKSRLERARALLRQRLADRGLILPAALFASLLTEGLGEAALPARLMQPTVKASTAFAAGSGPGALLSPTIVALAEGVLTTMTQTRRKLAMAVLMGIALVGGGAAALALPVPLDQPAVAVVQAEKGGEKVVREAAGVWPQWRGPNRDGVVHGVPVPTKWPRALTEEWKAVVGQGVASPVVVSGKVYVFTRQNDDERVICLDLHSGKEHWRSEPCPAPYKPGPGEGTADDRPRSTPTVADGRIFTLGMTGVLSCLDAGTGKLLWRKQHTWVHYGGTSPLVADSLCIVHVGDDQAGGLTGFDVRTGEVKWRYPRGGRPMSGSPILVDLIGERQLVTFLNWNAHGISVATGKQLWSVGPGSAGQPCTTAAQYRDLIILNNDREPLRALRLEKGDKGIVAKEVWKAKGLPLYYSSPVVAGDLVFGLSTRDGGCFFCLDARSGKTCWQSAGGQGSYASILNLGGVLLFLRDRGQLLVVKPGATAFEVIAEYRVGDRPTMAHPVFLGDRILIKDDMTLRSFRIEDASGKR
jgi:RNA polymerase sigma factor (sigma-70 family)